MSLRTFQLITHPLYLAHVEGVLYGGEDRENRPASEPPRIDRITDIAEYMKISPFTIRHILLNPSKNYRTFDLRKRDGSFRTIHAPRLFLKVVQWWIKDTILDRVPVDQSCHGFVKGRSFVTNAREHLGSRHVLNLDIKNCFPTLSAVYCERVFQQLRFNAAVSLQLAAICSLHGVLPQGAPTSPGLLNLVLKGFDESLRTICSTMGVKYTRYADDLTFSSQEYIAPSIIDLVQTELRRYDLELNQKKTRFMGPNQRKLVTGLVLGDNRVNLPKEYLNSLRGWLGHLERSSTVDALHLQKLRGTTALVREVGGANSDKLLQRAAVLLANEAKGGGRS